VHQQLEAGATDEEIIDFLVDRYGEFVRYRPGMDSNTLWLWSAPLILLVMAVAVVVTQIRKDRDGQTISSNTERANRLREKFDGDRS
jgi:cytochrome c-type biogenesis protein CcmH